MKIELTESEANSVVKLIDAALRNAGVNVLADANLLTGKIQAACIAERAAASPPTVMES